MDIRVNLLATAPHHSKAAGTKLQAALRIEDACVPDPTHDAAQGTARTWDAVVANPVSAMPV